MKLSDLYTADMVDLMELHELYGKHEWKYAGCQVNGGDQIYACECGLYGCMGDYTTDKTVYPVWGFAAAEPHWWMPAHYMDKCRYEAYRQLAAWTHKNLQHEVQKAGAWHGIITALRMETGITEAQPHL